MFTIADRGVTTRASIAILMVWQRNCRNRRGWATRLEFGLELGDGPRQHRKHGTNYSAAIIAGFNFVG
jgi:hypothetical protein